MLVCDKIYNMTEIPTPEHIEDRPHLVDPVSVAESLETVIEQLATPESLRAGLDYMLARQVELVKLHEQLRQEGKFLPSSLGRELDELNDGLLAIQHLNDRYNNPQQ